MRVVFPALLDGFDCGAADCACRAALRAAPAVKPLAAGKFPFRQAEKAMLRGAARLAKGEDLPAKPMALSGDYPIAAVMTPAGAELYFASLCPTVRQLLAVQTEAVDLARAEGGWRIPLQVFQPDDQLRDLRLTGVRTLPWRHYQTLREHLLDLVADSSNALLGRLARVASLIDAVVADQSLATARAPLTGRMFLAFRAFLESRCGALDGAALANAVGAMLPLAADLTLQASDITSLTEALQGDWRADVRQWLAVREPELGPAFEAYLALRVFAMPLDRDQTLQRAYAELIETVVAAMRLAAAVGQVRQSPVTPAMLVASLALAEAWIADAGQGLPTFQRPSETHDRGPKMADIDMTFESIC